ncbi:MAG: hypothetical protein KA369_08345 [Spirochaetes bacterium]|nr:hypothetical protein [Spirochaetota bacterium]
MAASVVKKAPSGSSLSGGGAGTSTTALAFGSAVTAGNLIVVVLQRWREASGTLAAATISDGAGNTWYKDAESINTRDGVTIWHCYANSSVAMSITAAFSDSAYWCISAYEVSGIAAGLTAGASGNNTGSGSSTSPSAGAVSPSGTCFYIGGVEFDAAVTCTEASGWTLGGEDESWTYAAGAVEYRTGSGSQTASWTLGTSSKWAAAVVAYAEAASATYGWLNRNFLWGNY